MGSLAMWSAVAGAGEGWGKGIQLQAQQEENENDRKHRSKLAELQIKAANDRALVEDARARELSANQIEAQRDIASQGAAVDAYTAGVQAETANKKITSQEKIGAGHDAARLSAAEMKAESSGKKDFTLSKQRVQIIEGGKIQEVEANIIIDHDTRMSFFPNGDKLQLASIRPEDGFYTAMPIKKIANKQAVNAYLNNSLGLPSYENKQIFLDKYGYLPAAKPVE